MRAASQLEYCARESSACGGVDFPHGKSAVSGMRTVAGAACSIAPFLVADVAAIAAGGAAHGLRPLPGIRAAVPPVQPLCIWFIWGHGTVLLMFIAAWLKPFPLYGRSRVCVRELSKPVQTGRKRRIRRAGAKKGGTYVPPFRYMSGPNARSVRLCFGRRTDVRFNKLCAQNEPVRVVRAGRQGDYPVVRAHVHAEIAEALVLHLPHHV